VNLVELEVVDLSRNLVEAVPTLHLRHQRHLLALNPAEIPILTEDPLVLEYLGGGAGEPGGARGGGPEQEPGGGRAHPSPPPPAPHCKVAFRNY
jgi:hypothetical protein